MSDRTNPEDYLSVPTLKARGWTDALIRQHLGAPDRSCPNPYYRASAPMRLYAKARVETVEVSPEWTDMRARVDRRRISAAKAVQTKRQSLRAAVEALVIEVPVVPWTELIRRSCDHYNAYHLDRGRWDAMPAKPTANPAFLHRICVNFLRHQLTSYEEELAKIYGKTGVQEAYILIKQQVLDAIAATYPQLAEACAQQRPSGAEAECSN